MACLPNSRFIGTPRRVNCGTGSSGCFHMPPAMDTLLMIGSARGAKSTEKPLARQPGGYVSPAQQRVNHMHWPAINKDLSLLTGLTCFNP